VQVAFTAQAADQSSGPVDANGKSDFVDENELMRDAEGLEDFAVALVEARLELEQDLARASLEAADAGVGAMQASHPYADRTCQLTGSMTAQPVTTADGVEAVIQVAAPYASFVDKGRFAFTATGEEAAARSLEELAAAAVDAFARKVST
jgi:hypothetical protein